MYRRRRKKRSTWFPVLGSVYNDGGSPAAVYNTAWEQVQLFTDPNSAEQASTDPTFPTMFAFALVPDFTPQVSAHDPDFTLRDFVEGQDWFLDAIVGTIHVCANSVIGGDGGFDQTQAWANVIVTAGIFVAPVREGNQVSLDLDSTEFDPQFVDNVRSPWIWRRTWILGNPGSSLNADIVAGGFPQTNSFITGNAGPGVHTKSKRRIRRNQRLFLVVATKGWDFAEIVKTNEITSQPFVKVLTDLRICGSLRRSRNQSAFH